MERPKGYQSSISIYKCKVKETYRETYLDVKVLIHINDRDIIRVEVEGPEGEIEVAHLKLVKVVSP